MLPEGSETRDTWETEDAFEVADVTEVEGARPLVLDAGEFGFEFGTMAMGIGCRPVPVSGVGLLWSSLRGDVSVSCQFRAHKNAGLAKGVLEKLEEREKERTHHLINLPSLHLRHRHLNPLILIIRTHRRLIRRHGRSLRIHRRSSQPIRYPSSIVHRPVFGLSSSSGTFEEMSSSPNEECDDGER